MRRRVAQYVEKMLYDNSPLLKLLADAWLVSEDDGQRALFKGAAEETAAWALREMQSSRAEASGRYFSTLDADAEGREGKFRRALLKFARRGASLGSRNRAGMARRKVQCAIGFGAIELVRKM